MCTYVSGQITIFHWPKFPWHKGSHFPYNTTIWGEFSLVWGRYNLTRYVCVYEGRQAFMCVCYMWFFWYSMHLDKTSRFNKQSVFKVRHLRHEKKPLTFHSLYWLFNRDPYTGLWWFMIIPIYLGSIIPYMPFKKNRAFSLLMCSKFATYKSRRSPASSICVNGKTWASQNKQKTIPSQNTGCLEDHPI